MKQPIREIVFKRLYFSTWKTSGIARRIKRRRYQLMLDCLGIRPPARVIEIGCGVGADFARFALEDGFDTHGIDLNDNQRMCDIKFTQGNARAMPFETGFFDVAVSIGVLEHIEPIPMLCEVTAEIARVSKRFCMVVPSIGSPVEPHAMSPFWSVRDTNKKRRASLPVNAYSDEAWRQFPGFEQVKTSRFWYMPGIQQLLIHN